MPFPKEIEKRLEAIDPENTSPSAVVWLLELVGSMRMDLDRCWETLDSAGYTDCNNCGLIYDTWDGGCPDCTEGDSLYGGCPECGEPLAHEVMDSNTCDGCGAEFTRKEWEQSEGEAPCDS